MDPALETSNITVTCSLGQVLDGYEQSVVISTCTGSGKWKPDPSQMQCQDSIVDNFYAVNCSEPNPPGDGFLQHVTSNITLFGCKEGHTPQGMMVALCVAQDTWSPDPAQLNCSPVLGRIFI